MLGAQEALVSNLRHDETSPWIIVMMVLIFLVCLTNGFTIYLTLTVARFRTVINIYLMSLAIADIIIGNICMPLTICEQMGIFNYGTVMCKIISFVQEVCVTAELWTRVAISIERYYAIVHPIRSRRWKCKSHAAKIIKGIWSMAALTNLPILFVATLQQKEDGADFQCREVWPTSTWEQGVNVVQLIVFFIIPFFFVSFACFLICRKLWRRMHDEENFIPLQIITRSQDATSIVRQQQSEGTSVVSSSRNENSDCQTGRHLSDSSASRSTHATNIADEKRIFIILTVIVIEFFICWLPLHIVNFIYLNDSEREPITNRMLLVAQFAGYFSTSFNPIIYFFINKNFWQELRNIFTK